MQVSCEHKDLCYDHSHMTDLRVDFDWSAAPDAEPGTMVVHFFRLPPITYTSDISALVGPIHRRLLVLPHT